ncbi:flagellar assembly protein FliW [Rossellomorea marisflavi]|uniref:flagellar assembly protein FliW n=1 Tax=Rossellomorea marisflavi TaxID=189381 RepID=UPI002079FB94|nr:flagellar assembly protein FliW [Rossellomorea marisflavi]USK91627.1 flagellar assembly protein FliW [Rossellomorea marisflavi]
MNIQTAYHGSITVNDEDLLSFPQGVPGFHEEKQFVLIPLEDNNWFQILQSTMTPDLAFITTNPFLYFSEYDFELDAANLEQLSNPTTADIQVLAILTVKDPFNESTANLQAPIIINTANKSGKQVILTNTNYRTQHQILAQPDGKKG